MPAFLTRWLTKAQDHGGGNGGNGQPRSAIDKRGNFAAMDRFLKGRTNDGK